MNIDEYIEKSSQKIGGKKRRLEFQREIRSHLEDRIEFYTAAGWDRETAIQKTLDRMGDPETVGDSMGRVHNDTASKTFDVLFVIASVFFVYLLFIAYSIALPFNDAASITSNVGDFGFLDELYFICIVPALMLLANRKGRHKVVMWILYLLSTSYLIFRMVSKYFCSPYLLKLYFILSGHRSDLDLFNYSYIRYNGIPLTVISVVIMLAFWAAETAIINSVSIEKHRNKKAVKRRTFYRRIFGTVLAPVIEDKGYQNFISVPKQIDYLSF